MNEEPVRSLQIVHSLGMGGAETWLMEVLRLWARTGEGTMDFLLTGGHRGIFDDEASSLGAKLHYIPFGKRSILSFRRDFRKLLRDGKYDALHDHQDHISGWHFMFGGDHLPGIRVTHVHNASHQILNNYGVSLRRRVNSQLGKMLVLRYVTHIAGTSNQLIREYGFSEGMFRGLPKSALYCGFDQARFAGDRVEARQRLLEELGWPDDVRIILYAGRIDRSPDPDHPLTSKNSGFAVDVAIASATREPRIRMILAGKPSDATPELEARAERAGVGDRIRFLGIRHDIEALMKASDLLLFPSRGEGLGMVAVEAQSAGLPVLMSTAVPEESIVVPELVARKNLKDGIESWSDEVINAVTRPKPMTLTEANERVAASPFSLMNSAKALRQLYANGSLPGGES